MKADQQQPALPAGEGEQRRLEQVLGHVVVERPFVVAHRVLVEPAPALGERPVEELLRLPAQRPLEHHGEPPLQLVLLAGDERAVVLGAEHLAEGRDVAEQRAGRLDVLHQPPQLGERVLHRRRREQQDRRRAQEAADPVGHQRLVRGLVVDAVAAVALVQPGEDLVRLVDDHQVERRRGAERRRAALAARELAADQEHARARGSSSGLSRAWMPKSLNSSFCHWPISDLGTISRMRCAPSARLCAMTSPASIVLPSPTSSARMQPPSRSRRSAKITASIWCGLGSIRAWRCDAA